MDDRNEFVGSFAHAAALIAQKLQNEGYEVIRGEAQEWAARFSLSKSNLDGCVTLFLNPRGDNERRVIVYRVLSENVLEGDCPVPEGSPENVAEAFAVHIERVIHGRLQPSLPQNPEVGRGLVSVSTGDAQLDRLRRVEDAEQSGR